MSESVYNWDALGPRSAALLDAHGGGNVTVVQASLVRALRGNGNAAIYLSQLLWWSKNKGDEEGWFWRTRDQMKEQCGLGHEAQKSAEKVLKHLDLLETDRRGMPAKKYYHVNLSAVESAILAVQQGQGAYTPDKGRGHGTPSSPPTIPPEHDEGAYPPDSTLYKSTNESTNESESNAHTREDESSEETQPPSSPSEDAGTSQDSGSTPQDEADPVEIYRRLSMRDPSVTQVDLIRTKIEDPDLWEEVVRWWCNSGYRKVNVQGMIEKYGEEQAQQSKDTGVRGVHYLTDHQKQSEDWEMGEDVALFRGTRVTEVEGMLRSMTSPSQFDELYEGAPDRVSP